jgi:hypothetical protein
MSSAEAASDAGVAGSARSVSPDVRADELPPYADVGAYLCS